jgi:hypothetical protein
MLQHPTLDQLRHLKLHGMARAFAELGDNAQAGELDHAQWLALLLDREAELFSLFLRKALIGNTYSGFPPRLYWTQIGLTPRSSKALLCKSVGVAMTVKL